MRLYIMQLMVVVLTGCANGIPDISANIDNDIEQSNEKIFVGLPVLASLEGTTVRLDDSWLLTAKHNHAILALQGADVYYHPDCDIALIRDDGISHTKVGVIHRDQKATHVGYPIGLPMSSSQGEYVGDIFVSGWDKCQKSATTGVVMAGMSGGGVYNEKGELIGINHGFSNATITWQDTDVHRPAVFVSLYAVRDWLRTVTGKEYFDETS
ncbi:serine protease [Vibrio coralliilyticus]|uniref:serine protease n=1 Tax=Vibrio coralliilyticus TaxID=190893 RepID=UPI001E3F9E2E|nr:serine protease [Vibrio coralliilyticus]MCC2525804.1 serine protease [Vibrio coralliilyticus]